ncbi:MAG TPA: pitrilysin family protein [Phycisphaerae bacterium]|nr:pitrilysin family protein [Phycisphaerae bacterium]
MKSLVASACLVLALTALPARAQNVAYEKYVLDNGMTVILHEDHSLPAACINLWYRVGSKDEAVGRSGFAHLFEHLMFMGTRRVPDGDFDTLMESGGGWNNATTSEDRTNYFSMGPAELLPTLLWLDADRLEDLGKEMTLEKLDKQRAVVRNERRQSVENVPYGKANHAIYQIMFPEGHPYHGTVIGSHEDLESATVDDVKNFFATYYVPSNASLVVAGDFDPNEIKPLVNRLFGTLPRGSEVIHAEAKPVQMKSSKTLTYTDNVQNARTHLVYHSPARFQPGDAEMDLAAEILASGISSRLYQELIYKNDLATDVSAYQASSLLGSLFFIEATAKPGVELQAIEDVIDQTVATFLKDGPTNDELERQKAQLEYDTVSELQSILTKADRLNMYEFYYGEPNSFKADLDRYRNTTPQSVRDAARNVLKSDARLVMRVIPEIKTPDANPRENMPESASAKAFNPPSPTSFTLSNGIQVHHWQRSELPLIELRFMWPMGSDFDPPSQSGLSSLTADMLDEGAGERSAIEFSDRLDALGASFAAGSSHESTSAQLSALSRNFGDSLELAADAILRPQFDKNEWDRVHRLQVEQIKQRMDFPAAVASLVGMRTFFGDAHPYSRSSEGTVESVEAISLDDAKAWHKSVFRPDDVVIFCAGDISESELKTQLEKYFAGWKSSGSAMASAPKYVEATDRPMRVVLVDRPDAVQTVVSFYMPAPKYASPKRNALDLLGTILGGSFTSRLNQNLREDKGYTYGARCSYSMNPNAGYFTAAARVRADVTGASIGEFLKEFKAIRSGDITDDETAKSQATVRMQTVQSFAGLAGMISVAAELVRNSRPLSDLPTDLAAIKGVSTSQLNSLAHDAIPLDNAVLVLVGDKATILPQLEGLGLPEPEEYSPEGDPL